MTSTLKVPVEITAALHEIEGGGYWAEVACFPGCVAQGETLEGLKTNVVSAIGDWLAESRAKTADEARQLAAIQGGNEPANKTFSQCYEYLPPSSWNDENE
jgi:predicted RNase H-like HicB family nuclease